MAADLLDQPVVGNTSLRTFLPVLVLVGAALFVTKKGGPFRSNPRRRRHHRRKSRR